MQPKVDPTPDEQAREQTRRRQADDRRKSSMAFGVAAICVLFILETQQAHRIQPHAASGLVWSILGLGALVGVALGLWFRHRSRQ